MLNPIRLSRGHLRPRIAMEACRWHYCKYLLRDAVLHVFVRRVTGCASWSHANTSPGASMMMEAVHLASHNDVQMSQGASADRSSFCMRANHMKPSLMLQNHDTSPLALERGRIELQTALATIAAWSQCRLRPIKSIPRSQRDHMCLMNTSPCKHGRWSYGEKSRAYRNVLVSHVTTNVFKQPRSLNSPSHPFPFLQHESYQPANEQSDLQSSLSFTTKQHHVCTQRQQAQRGSRRPSRQLCEGMHCLNQATTRSKQSSLLTHFAVERSELRL